MDINVSITDKQLQQLFAKKPIGVIEQKYLDLNFPGYVAQFVKDKLELLVESAIASKEEYPADKLVFSEVSWLDLDGEPERMFFASDELAEKFCRIKNAQDESYGAVVKDWWFPHNLVSDEETLLCHFEEEEAFEEDELKKLMGENV